MKTGALALLVVGALVLGGCSVTETATDFNGLSDLDGNQVMHLNTTNVGLHLMWTEPVWGNATLEQTVSDLTSDAKIEGAQRVRIVQSKKHTMWYILPPISFVIPPVITNVAGDATP